MIRSVFKSTPAILVVMALMNPSACAQLPGSGAANASPVAIEANANSIQPETTLTVSATQTLQRAPDIAFINVGVRTDGKTASEALSENAARMNGVFDALNEAGVEKKNIQTTNFNIRPRYDNGKDRSQRLIGYAVTNGVNAKVTDLDALGETIDGLIAAGGNTLNGIRFALEDNSEVLDEARRGAVKAAVARAELYADAANYRVVRIVSMSEGGGVSPQPRLAAFASAARLESAPSPVAAGELDLSASVSVVFELAPK